MLNRVLASAAIVLVLMGCGGDRTVCGAGTHLDGDECTADDASVTCAAGTHHVAGGCAPDGVDAGEAFGDAAPDAKVDASPADAAPDAGPVDAAPDASPTDAAPDGSAADASVGSAAACAGSGNVIYFDGDAADYIHRGMDTIRVGVWRPFASASDIRINMTPQSSTQGLWWDLEFSSRQLGQPLMTQVYASAERASFASAGHPGIDIGGDGRGCNTITGKFQIQDLVWNGSTLQTLTATFEQHCEGASPALRGCIHYEAP